VGWQLWRCWLTGRWTFASSVNDVFAVCAVGVVAQILADSVHSDSKKDDIVFPHMAAIGCVVNALAAGIIKHC